ncbi:MAG: hypothetical protein NTX03_06060 [Bacteroidetes bacterium]|nr:hypothetical protein [Bacteroidota bacterium]
MNNKIAKFDNGQLGKIGNQIAITNKLLDKGFDYLKWYYSLDECWRNPILLDIKLMLIWDEGKTLLLNSSIKKEEEVLYTYEEEFEANNQLSKTELIKIIIGNKSFHIGTNKMDVLENLNPLNMFPNLENLEIRNVDVESLESQYSLKKLKTLKINKSKVSFSQLEAFKKRYPNCEIIINE